MKKYLIPKSGNFYKANLHCHSNVSDGAMSPESIKDAYKEKGYSVVAYTDHNILLSRAHLCDDSFIALNGYELDVSDSKTKGANTKTCHMCFIAIEPDNLTQVLYHREWYRMEHFTKFDGIVKYDEAKPNYVRIYEPEKISEMMKVGREHGFFVTYNHPTWSLENYEQYTNYHGMHAMEIYNNTCNTCGFDEYNSRVYDDMLRAGEKIFCTATDDNHRHEDMFGGFTMIKAEKLEYKAITDSLVKGNFYCSQGPEIYELYIEGGFACIECSDAVRITYNTANRRPQAINKNDGGLTSARFKVSSEDKYFRITVTDKSGKHADTNAYFVDELI